MSHPLPGTAPASCPETTTRTNSAIHSQWVFLSDKAVLHKIATRRARSVAEDVLSGHQPEVWVSHHYAGQQELGKEHQVCLAHVLRDVQYAIDSGVTVLAPKIRDHLRWAIRVGKGRPAMARVRLKGLNSRCKVLADGTEKTYYYA